MTYFLVVLLLGINVMGILLKKYTRRRIKDMDGISDIYTAEQVDGNLIARF